MNESSPRAVADGGRPFQRVSLARQFLLASAVMVALGVAATGNWAGRQIETSEVDRAARIAAVYVESILASRLAEVIHTGEVSPETRRLLDDIFVTGPLARRVVRFKLWTADGRIPYSSHSIQEAGRWPLHEHVTRAFAGELQAGISDLDGPENAAERKQWKRLIEVYVPLRAPGSPQVSLVAEFYHSMEHLDDEIEATQRQSWVALTLGGVLLMAGLYALIHRASLTISGQQSDLQVQLKRMQRLLDDNRAMNLRLQQAGAQTTSMSELALRRIAADLHDGPAQDLAFALLRLDDGHGNAAAMRSHADRMRETLQRAMASLRNITDGLVVPGMEQFKLADVVRRAAADATRKSGVAVAVQVDEQLGDAPQAVKITAYRVLQEALSNALRYAPGRTPRVTARQLGGHLALEVADDGPGFDPESPAEAGHLGLAFLRERVQLLGGTLIICSAPGQGTVLGASIPLHPATGSDD
jgi:signal transduction histidine kinase